MFEIRGLQFKTILDIEKLVLEQPVVCITGPSGGGKTTLLKMLNGLLVPDRGEIFYKGESLAGMNLVALRRRVVMLAQSPVIYPGTVEENLQIGLRFSEKLPASKEQLRQVLETVNLDKGLEEGCAKLSGGEKQRLCLGRVLLMDAETYLLDEPSAALDQKTEEVLTRNLARLVRERGKQLILITHSDEIAAEFPDGRVVLEGGRVRHA